MPTRVLLTDDNLPDRVRYRRMLQRVPDAFEIVEAEDGAGALVALQAAAVPFDCVLLDQDLPDMQGLDVLDDIRQSANPPPVVMLTGEEDAAVSIDALRRGAADYLMKRRIDEDRLQRAIQGAIERARLSRQLRDNEQPDRGRAVHRRRRQHPHHRMQRGRAHAAASGSGRHDAGHPARRFRQPRAVAGLLPPRA